MNAQFRAGLGALLDQYDETRRAAQARSDQAAAAAAIYLAQFAELRRDVVRPVFEAAAAMLGARGHQVSVVEQDFSVDTASKVAEAGISLQIVPAGTGAAGRAERLRTLSITTRHYNKTVSINSGKPLEGAKGTYTLDRLNEQLVEEEVIRFVGTSITG